MNLADNPPSSSVQRNPAADGPVLVRASEQLEHLTGHFQYTAELVGKAAEEMLLHFVGSHADTSALVGRLQQTFLRLSRGFDEQFGRQYFGDDGGPAMDPREWVAHAETLAAAIQTMRPGWTQTARAKQKSHFQELTARILRSFSPTRREFDTAEWNRMVRGGTVKAEEIRAAALLRAPGFAAPPPPIGPYAAPVDAMSAPMAGPGPLKVCIGTTTAETLTLRSTMQGLQGETDKASVGALAWQETHTLAMPELAFPVIIDLDAVGAFAVDSAQCLETAVLNLLSALPANQLLLPIFDPERGGDSAKFLFALGDAAERIIGDRVKTSDRELTELLTGLEEHITFVTQRFLQGEHVSLTEYNKAAGEVAEPYRILILYDFPSGFSRGGHYDEDLLAQLNRIVRNGPRCGVFPMLVCPELARHRGTAEPAMPRGLVIPGRQEASADGQLSKTLRGMHCFVAGGELSSETVNLVGRQLGAGVRLPAESARPAAHSSGAQVSEGSLHWIFRPAPAPDPAVAASLLDVVKRNVHAAADVQVTPRRVAELAGVQLRDQAATFGQSFTPPATPQDPQSWWRRSSAAGVTAYFGRIGARGIADLVLSSDTDNYGALIGGRPGSGKSVLLHAVIMSIALEYSPNEVELFLIDFKEGVEFAYYGEARLPHARVVAIESERDFGLSVLRLAADEIARRGKLFRNEGDGAANLLEYRQRTGRGLKRMVLIIDEFQQLFDRSDKVATEAAEILELILRQGRAFGIHLVLASQSLAGMTLDKHVLRLVPTRIALQSTESDSRLILGEENTDAQLLVRAGEGVINRSASGSREANQRFQAAYWDPEERLKVLWQLRERAEADQIPESTTVFAGHKPAGVTSAAREAVLNPTSGKGLGLPVGMPLTLDSHPVVAELRRQEASNLLIVDEQGSARLAVAIGAAAHQGARVEVLDFVGDDDRWRAQVGELELSEQIAVAGRRATPSVLTRISELVSQRHDTNDFRSAAVVLALASMGRARDFEPDAYGDNPLGDALGHILRDGPEVGVHVVCWFDRPSGISKRLTREQVNEFGQRLVGVLRREDSAYLIDSENAATLKPGQGILADLDRGSEQRLRMFDTPPPGWLAATGTADDD